MGTSLVSFSSSGSSTTVHSVINIVPATDTAFSNAVLVTLVGSIIPSFIKSTYLFVIF